MLKPHKLLFMKEQRFITTSIYRYLLVLECKTRGRQLHLAKRFGPKRAFFSCKKRYKQIMQDEKHSRINRGGAMQLN